MTTNQPLTQTERRIVDEIAAGPDADAKLHEVWLAAREQGMTPLCNYVEITRSMLADPAPKIPTDKCEYCATPIPVGAWHCGATTCATLADR